MIKSMLTTAILLTAGTAGAQQTLTIISQDYEAARQAATKQHKLLLVDFYTSWCAPCKVLDKTIFQNDSIAAEIAKNFIVLKYDAEKDIPYNLSLKHHICSYPTTLVLSPDGRPIHKMYGTGGKTLPAGYARLLQESLELYAAHTYLSGYSAAIDTNAYPLCYKNYVRRIADLKPGELDRYWAKHSGPLSETDFAMLAYFGRAPRSVNDHLLQHKAQYERLFGKADVKFVTGNMIGDQFMKAIAQKDPALYDTAVQAARLQMTPAEAGQIIKTYGLQMRCVTGKWNDVLDTIAQDVCQNNISDHELNYYCWQIYEQCSDPEALSRAILLMKNLTETRPEAATLDTYARLLFKAGDKKTAATVMQQAVATGKAKGEDTSDSEKFLDQTSNQ